MHGLRHPVDHQPGAARKRGEFQHPKSSQKLLHQMSVLLGKALRPQEPTKCVAIRAGVMPRQMVS